MRHRRYQKGCLFREKRKASPDVWVFRWRDGQVNRKEQIGTVEQFKTKGAAQKACESLRSNANREARSPRTVAELLAHYKAKELSEECGKACSTRQVYGSYIRTWVLPSWGAHSLSSVKAVDVEAWLSTLPLANGSRAKIRSIMSALFTHAQRYEWLDRNPIQFVRQSAKRERIPDVLTVEEIGRLLGELPEHCRIAVLLAVTTGLRVSELLALKWIDVDFVAMVIRPCRAIVDQVVGSLKTEASGKAVPMDTALASELLDWRGRCPYNQDADFLFGSPDMDGTSTVLARQPLAKDNPSRCHTCWNQQAYRLAFLQADTSNVAASERSLRQSDSGHTASCE